MPHTGDPCIQPPVIVRAPTICGIIDSAYVGNAFMHSGGWVRVCKIHGGTDKSVPCGVRASDGALQAKPITASGEMSAYKKPRRKMHRGLGVWSFTVAAFVREKLRAV